MKIKQLRFTIRPAEQIPSELVCLEWEIAVPDEIIGYRKVFSQTYKHANDDFKSYWDWMWETAKREVEKYQENKLDVLAARLSEQLGKGRNNAIQG